MKELKIVKQEQEGYFAYHIAADAGQFLDHTTQTNVPLELLFDGGLGEEDVYRAYNIDRFRFSDNYLLYYWIAKAFLALSENYVICFDSLAEVEKNQAWAANLVTGNTNFNTCTPVSLLNLWIGDSYRLKRS